MEHVVSPWDACTLRRAEHADARELWRLANASGVRENAFHSAPIPYDTHVAWLARKLDSDEAMMWVLVGESGLLAQVRYDRVDAGTALIDITVAPDARGRGIGAELLRRTHRAACQGLAVGKTRGVVFKTNVASARIFEKAGFREMSEETHNGIRCRVFDRACDGGEGDEHAL